ncbi:MAG: transporter substrate-binding domain-containing protein [Desulfobacteraceae bacterium]|nr:transporter substrate-binding domain-containing protein [Desulfobacteraceae bacterium]
MLVWPAWFLFVSAVVAFFLCPSLQADSAMISSGCEYDYPPYSAVTKDQQAEGFSVELLVASLKAMGREVSFRPGHWNDLKKDLLEGGIKVLPMVSRTHEREQIYDFSFPYITMHGTIVVHKDTTSIRSLADLEGKQVAVMKGDYAEEFFDQIEFDAEIVTTNTSMDALAELANGRHDAVVMQKLVGLQLMKQGRLTDLRIAGPPLKSFKQSFCFAVQKGDQELLAILNEGLSIVIADGTFRQLSTKWFAPLEAIGPGTRQIIIGGDDNYPPYEFLDENGEPAGFNVDLTRAIARRLGIPVEIQLKPWASIREALETNKIDALQGMFYSPERDVTAEFSPAHTIVSHGIVVRKGSKMPDSVADLSGKSILVQAGDIMHDFAVRQGYGTQLIAVETPEKALELLAKGRYDCALITKVPALYLIEKKGYKNLLVSRQSMVPLEYCYAVSNDNGVLLARMSEALTAIKNTGEYRKIYSKWLGLYEKPEIGFWEVLNYSLYLIIPFCVLLMGSFVWSRTLQRKVLDRTAELELEMHEHKLTGEAFRESQVKYRAIMESMKEPVYICSQDFLIKYMNPIMVRRTGRDARGEKCFKAIHGFDKKCPWCDFEAIKQGNAQELEILSPKDNHSFYISSTPVVHDDGTLTILNVYRDITKIKKIEARLQQAQKMEAIGTLAGGIAHDFNNILFPIIGYTELLLEDFPQENELQDHLTHILTGAKRAGELVKQILTFSRQTDHELKPLRAQVVIKEALKLIASSLPSTIKIDQDIDKTCEVVLADPTRIHQIVMNLSTNAFHAMEETGGNLTVSYGEVELLAEDMKDENMNPGKYACLTVKDTGMGMDQKVMDRIFDPYFTTKEEGKGTGLGLSVIHGIVKSYKGNINVYSEPGQGTEFQIHIPTMENMSGIVPGKVTGSIQKGNERVLLVDDQEDVVLLEKQMLERLGYHVTTQISSRDALNLFRADPDGYDLIITDMTMPNMTGDKLAGEVIKIRPDMPVILCTGFSDVISREKAASLGLREILLKPVLMKELSISVRKVLDKN